MHRHQVRVYYEDTDAGGIVYYANYLKFMERARTEWLRSLGFEQDTLMEQSVAFVVRRVEMHNYAPARFNELLSIDSQVVELKGASMTFKQTIKNKQETILVTAEVFVAEPVAASAGSAGSLLEEVKTWHPVLLGFLGTCFGWGTTALGSAGVIIHHLTFKG